MKIGLLVAGIGRGAWPGTLRILAEHCERLNFGTIWAPEHVVLFDQQDSKYPYSEDGRFAASSTSDWMDPFVALSYIAARSERIRLATGICLVPEHNPLELAKVVASVDRVSGGRFALGVGIGWSAEEFAALGIGFERRNQRTREYLEVMRRLWSEERTDFDGEFVKFKGVRSYPKPVQAKVPIIFGGESGPALKRVADCGDGWFGFNLAPDEARSKIKRLHELMRECGRLPSEVELIISPYTKRVTAADLRGYHEAGVSEVVMTMQLAENEAEIPAQLEQCAREWVAPAAHLG
ncbi:MAG: LLM class F420-dependent oxidoreductase [Candidatus Binataceae bacterium]